MTAITRTITTTRTAMTTQPEGATPATPPQTDAADAAPGPADTPRISGELAGRLLRSSRWQQ